MPLIACQACNAQISPNATSCPHCGEPTPKKAETPATQSSGLKAVGGFLVVGSVVGCVALEAAMPMQGWSALAVLLFLVGLLCFVVGTRQGGG